MSIGEIVERVRAEVPERARSAVGDIRRKSKRR